RRESAATRARPRSGRGSPRRRYRKGSPDQAREDADHRRLGVRHLDPLEAHPELARALPRLRVEVPADLEVVGDESDWADEDIADAACLQVGEVVEDVGPEPRLAGLRLALERERPVSGVEPGALGHKTRRLEELI